MNIKLRFLATEDGKELEVIVFQPVHKNHANTEQEFNLLPSQRKVDNTTEKEMANKLMGGMNRKTVQHEYSEKTGKPIFMKDVHNIATKARKLDPTCSNDSSAQEFADWIKKNYPALDTEIVVEEHIVKEIFAQDNQMKDILEKYPETLLVDATYKTNNLNMPLYALMAIDGNGASQIVGFFVVSSEDEPTLRKMVQVFKTKNPCWENIEVEVTDKDMTERIVFKSEMPHIQLQLCLFHVLRTFKREITVEKYSITGREKDTILDKLQSITYSSSEDYDKHYTEF